MTQLRKTKIVPAVPKQKVEVITGHACDVCGKEAGHKSTDWVYLSQDSVNWSREPYQVHGTVVSTSVGSDYPEGTMVEIQSYHICPECFDTKLRPIFGTSEPTVREIDC